MTTILTFLTALIPLVTRIMGNKPTEGDLERKKLAEIHDADTKFETTGDTTDLGKLP